MYANATTLTQEKEFQNVVITMAAILFPHVVSIMVAILSPLQFVRT